MHHSFDIEHARLYGLEEAVFISNLQFWISKNAANGVNLHDGRTWTYNSAKAFTLLFPYLSPSQIRRTIDSLVNQSVVLKGNYSPLACDRTLWLAFADEDAFLAVKKPAPKSSNGAPKSAKGKAKPAPISSNGCAEIGESLIRTDVNADSKHTDGESAVAQVCVLVCQKMQEAGVKDAMASDAVLAVLVGNGDGVDVGMFVDAAKMAVNIEKGFAYALGIVKNKMAAAASLASVALATPAPAAAPAGRVDVSKITVPAAPNADAELRRRIADSAIPRKGPSAEVRERMARIKGTPASGAFGAAA